MQAVTDMIMSAKATGATQVNTNVIVNQLNSMGYGVSVESLISSLDGNPIIQSANQDNIVFKGNHMMAVGGDEAQQDSEQIVKNLAADEASNIGD